MMSARIVRASSTMAQDSRASTRVACTFSLVARAAAARGPVQVNIGEHDVTEDWTSCGDGSKCRPDSAGTYDQDTHDARP